MPTGDPNKTVFISYRRKVSSFIARAIFLDLRANGYDVFLDVDSIDSGTFDTIILNQIAARAHFLVILTPGTLNGCVQEGDWLRREIEYAMEQRRNIVPVLCNDFKFSSKIKKYLVGELENLPRLNGLTLPHEYFDAAMERLRNRFLKQPVSGAILIPTPVDEAHVVAKKIEEVASQPKPTEIELNAEDYFVRAYEKYESGDLDGAIQDYTEAIRLNPDYLEAYNNRGVARGDQGDVSGALADYDKAIELKPDYAETYSNRAGARLQLGDVNGVIADYSRTIKLKPDYAEAYFGLGVIRELQGDMSGAQSNYDKAIELKPNDAYAYHNRGTIRGQLGDMSGAITDYDKAIELKPNNAGFISGCAEALFQLHEYIKALADFKKANELRPDYPMTIGGLAITHHAMGNVDEAKRLWGELVKRNACYRDAEWVRQELEWSDALVDEARKLIAAL